MAKRIESPSSVNTFKQCPRKYYYQYIAKLPTLPNIHQVRGNIAHSTLEYFYNLDLSEFSSHNYERKFKEAMQKLFLNTWSQYQGKLTELKLSEDQKKFYFEETMFMLMNWTNHFLEQITAVMNKKKLSLNEAFIYLTPIREEQYLSDRYSVRGFIDAIHYLEEETHIIDYKTNSNFEFKESIKLQLAIYSLLYFEKEGKLPSKAGIFFLRHKLKWINVDETLLELAKTELELIHSHTTKTEAIEDYPKSISSLCKWSTGKCDFHEACRSEK